MREAKQADGRLHALQGQRRTASPPTCCSPGCVGYQRNPFMREFWKYVDIDPDRASARRHDEQRRMRRIAAGRAAGRCALAGAGARARRRAQPRRDEGAALRLPRRRDRLRPGADHRPVLAHRHAAHLRGAVPLRPPGAAGQDQAAARPTACPRSSADFRTWTVRMQARASSSPTTRPSRASSASWSRRTTSTPQALRRPGQQEPGLAGLPRASAFVGLAELRERRARRARSRSTTTAESRACARSTATRCSSSSRSRAPRFLETLADGDLYGARGARGGRGLRRQDRWRTRWAPGRSGWRSGGALADRAGAQPDYREVLYDAEPAADDAEGQALLARFKGRTPADGRPRRDRRSSRRRSRAGWRS